MTILKNYNQFDGRHWETGSVHNALAYQGVKGSQNRLPLSEALLLGVSGGIAFGHFSFHYEGYDPQLVILTRNTFDPLQTLLERLGIVQTVLQTTTADKALTNLIKVLEDGLPAIVWADMATLSYNNYTSDKGIWGMSPLIVYGHDGKTAYIADRSAVPLEVSAKQLADARGRVKKEKFRVVSLDTPNIDKLPAAVQQGIWQCIRLFTEKPPRGTRKNFGLSGYANWAKMLTNARNPQSWERYFAPGAGMFAALTGALGYPGLYGWIGGFGDGGAERRRYADFLDEAAVILHKPGLKNAAKIFRESHAAWKGLAHLSLPDDVPLLKEARQLLDKRAVLFREKGADALDEIVAAKQRLKELRAVAAQKFPMSPAEITAYRQRMADHVLKIRDIEARAVDAMKDALA